MQQIQNDISEKELYELMATKYGEDIALLAKLRLNEIYRLLREELCIAGQESQEIAIGNEMHLLFMQKFFALLERDHNFLSFWTNKYQ